jgi:hypothetical protein
MFQIDELSQEEGATECLEIVEYIEKNSLRMFKEPEVYADGAKITCLVVAP